MLASDPGLPPACLASSLTVGGLRLVLAGSRGRLVSPLGALLAVLGLLPFLAFPPSLLGYPIVLWRLYRMGTSDGGPMTSMTGRVAGGALQELGRGSDRRRGVRLAGAVPGESGRRRGDLA